MMRMLFIICIGIMHSNAMAATSAAEEKFDAVFSICESVVPVGHSDFAALNNVSPGAAATVYFQVRHITLNKSEPRKVTLLEKPRHGELIPHIEYLTSYMYHPNQGYLGPDKMTFSFEAMGKIFKVIYTVYINRSSEYIAPECGNNYDIKEMPSLNKVIGKGNK
jgi:hypothetical protein